MFEQNFSNIRRQCPTAAMGNANSGAHHPYSRAIAAACAGADASAARLIDIYFAERFDCNCINDHDVDLITDDAAKGGGRCGCRPRWLERRPVRLFRAVTSGRSVSPSALKKGEIVIEMGPIQTLGDDSLGILPCVCSALIDQLNMDEDTLQGHFLSSKFLR